jgi:UbiD family decarboxylase
MDKPPYDDLRGFIAQVEALGALRRIDGADPAYELGGITEVAAGMADCPALLFDSVKGFARGFRVFTNATVSPQRAALALGIDPRLAPVDALKEWRRRRASLTMHKPVTVKCGAALENSTTQVDLARFPAPVWHRQDGGPYIGSGSIVVMRDPDSGWVNASIYRVQVHSRDRVTVQFYHQGRHGAIIARKYWERGEPCPVAVVNGPDPSLFIAGFEYLPEGASEYDFAGAIRGRPVEVLEAPHTGCRYRRTRKSFSKAISSRTRRCRRGRSASSPAITPPTSGPGPSCRSKRCTGATTRCCSARRR